VDSACPDILQGRLPAFGITAGLANVASISFGPVILSAVRANSEPQLVLVHEAIAVIAGVCIICGITCLAQMSGYFAETLSIFQN
jgi:hypothetical protein